MLLIAVLAVLPLWGASFPSLTAAQAGQWPLMVHFFDVDQGDSILFQGPDFTILVDAGRHDRSDVVPHLTQAGVTFIDLFILTHPHADHIGQCAAVMERFVVGEVWMSGGAATTRTFERCVDAILASDAGYHEPRAGEVYQIGSARVEVLHPSRLSGDFNNDSIVARIVYGDVAFLMTGDAEAEAESSILRSGRPVRAQVLKLGHHGSSTSSTLDFLRAVSPEVAIYSAGRGNSYGHPHVETLRAAAALGLPLYGTDVSGTIRVGTDGRRYEVYVERGGPVAGAAGSGVAPAGAGVGQGAADTGAGVASGSGQAAMCVPPYVNINTASADELTRIVHVGPAIAQRIIAARPFGSLEDLLRVSGIGEQRLADILAQGLACVGP